MMMACWKQNEFRDEACRKEIQDFFDCSSRAQVTGCLLGKRKGNANEWLALPCAKLWKEPLINLTVARMRKAKV